jgi:LmbE family N-acetylglucosaminyl deacetylase
MRIPMAAIRLQVVLCTMAMAAVCAAPLCASVLVIAPHPDDDIITAAGVIQTARRRGEPTTVLYMTNGDFTGIAAGKTREAEAVSAQQLIGSSESNLIFLGYPDRYLATLQQSYPSAADRFVSPLGQGTTYADRGLGKLDYHHYRYGVSAPYNWANLVHDLQLALQAYRPSQIYVTSRFDAHPDHSASYAALMEALQQISSTDRSFVPAVHETLVHIPADENLWPIGADPSAYYVQPPTLGRTTLRWADRESLDVPANMQFANLTPNLKYKALLAHVSQGGHCDYVSRFAHRDEIFWVSSPLSNNQPPIVNAGVNQTVTPGALVWLDGTDSRDPEAARLGYRWTQSAGPAVQLSNAQTARPSFVAPANATDDNPLTFQLVVSDGQFSSPPDSVQVTVANSAGFGINVARSATASASSANTATGSTAAKAIDGVISGAPVDPKREWATVNQKAGSLKLTWPTAQYIDKLVLYDRPNLTDQIACGTLSFSDGTSIRIGTLDNAASEGRQFDIAPRNITSLTLSILRPSPSTTSVGLAELQAFDGRSVAQRP